MTRLPPIGALPLLLALASGSVAAAAQQAPTRSSDRQVEDLLSRIDKRTDTFRSSFDRAIDRNPINGSREEDQINRSVKDFEQSTDRLRDRVSNHESGAADVEEVLCRASLIDRFMMHNQLDAAAEDDWKDLRQDLDQLAYLYDVTWTWTRSDRMDDEQLEHLLQRIAKGARQFRTSLAKALDESPRDRSTAEDDIDQLVTEFAETTDHLKDHFGRNQVVTTDIEDVLRRGVSIEDFMKRNRLNEQAQNDWLRLRRDLDDLALAYNLAWSWSDPQYARGCRYEALSSPDRNVFEATRFGIAWVARKHPVWGTSSQ